MADDATDTYHLSDGSMLDVPAGTDAVTATRMVNQAEQGIDTSNMQRAASQNSPVYDAGNGKVYSASMAYPDTVMGHAMAWLDHNAGGNWANKNIVQTTPGSYVNAVAGPVGRAESNAMSWIYDLPATLYNVVKHQATPGSIAANAPDAPYLSQAIRSEAGVPELSPDAPLAQRIGEGALAAWLSPGVGAKNTADLAQSLYSSTMGTLGLVCR